MDHLNRSPLLLEFSTASRQHLKPRGAPKALTHRIRQKTSASMPTRRGEAERQGRRFEGKLRMNQARDIHPSSSKRRAEDVRKKARPNPHTSHLSKKRKNPNAPSRPRSRGNPQARDKTQIRTSPSREQHRPTLAKTPQTATRRNVARGGGL